MVRYLQPFERVMTLPPTRENENNTRKNAKERETATKMASSEVMDVQVAEAVAVLPPRPDAIMTLLTTDDFLLGVQTLLYSVKVSDARNRVRIKEVPLNQGNLQVQTRTAVDVIYQG